MANRSCDESKRDDTSAGDQAEGDDPFIADGVDVRPDKCNCDDKVSERQPVRTVGEEGILRTGLAKRIVNTLDPRKQTAGLSERLHGCLMEKGVEPSQLRLQREGSHPA